MTLEDGLRAEDRSVVVVKFLQSLKERESDWIRTVSHLAPRTLRGFIELEDILQEAMLRAYEHREQFREEGDVRKWFMVLLRNTTRRLVRDHRAIVRLKPEALREDSRAHPSTREGQTQSGDCCYLDRDSALDTLLDRLPVEQREVIESVVLDGCSVRTFARHAGVSKSVMSSRLYRAKAHLRELIHAPSTGRERELNVRESGRRD